MISGFKVFDGELTIQAGIVKTASVMTHGSIRSSNVLKGASRYSPGLPNAAYTILRGDLLFSLAKRGSQFTQTGVAETSVFGSFSNLPKPAKEDIDTYCENLVFAGISKNTLTNPGDGNYSATMGNTRPNSFQVAALLAGSFTVHYNGSETVHYGDTIIFSPPNIESDYSNNRFSKNSRNVGVLKPLQWTSFSPHNANANLLEKCVMPGSLNLKHLVSPEYLSRVSQNQQFALQKKRFILSNIIAGLLVAQRRGLVKIITPLESQRQVSLKSIELKAIEYLMPLISKQIFYPTNLTKIEKENIISLCFSHVLLLNDIKNNPNHHMSVNPATVLDFEKYSNLEEILQTGGADKEFYTSLQCSSPQSIGETFDYYGLGQQYKGISTDLRKQLVEEDEIAINWMTSVLGLGMRNMENDKFTSDVIKMILNAEVPPDETKKYFETYSSRSTGRKIENDDWRLMEHHIKNADRGYTSAMMNERETFRKRIVGKAISDTSPSEKNLPETQQPTLDLIINSQ